MKYTYIEDRDRGTWRPDFIEYTGNTYTNPQLMPYNKVKFYYSIRSDSTLGYIGGSQVKNNTLLRKIRTYANGDFVRDYNFTYFKDDFKSCLNEITEVSYTGERFNSTIINWGDKTSNIICDTTDILYNYPGYEIQQIIPGDYNGDGVEDVFLVYRTKEEYFPSWKIKWFNIRNQLMHDVETLEGNDSTWYFNVFFIKGDFNRDGFDDLLRFEDNFDSTHWITTNTYVYENKKSGGANTFKKHGGDYLLPPTRAHESNRFLTADIDGDSQSEVLRFYYDQSKTDYYIAEAYEINIGIGSSAIFIDSLRFDNTNLFSPYEFIDFNGNHKAEIIHIKGDHFQSYELGDDRKFKEAFCTGFPTEYHYRFYGDFNGDGKTDILTYHEEPGWQINFSTGEGWYEIECPLTKEYDPTTNNNYNVFTIDVNGDGLCDIVETYPVNDGYRNYMRVFKSQGETFVWDGQLYDEDVFKLSNNKIVYGDFNGDGGDELLFDARNTDVDNFFVRFSYNPNDQSHMVTGILNGLNHKIEFTYKNLLADNYFYTIDKNPPSPTKHFAGPIPAVRKVRYDLGDNQENCDSTLYNYRTLWMSKNGKGMIGMESVTSHNYTNNKKIVSYFNCNSNYQIQVLDFIQTWGGTDAGQLLTAKETTFDIFHSPDKPDKCFIQRPISLKETDHLSDIVITTIFVEYDDFGNVEKKSVNFNGQGTTITRTNYAGYGSWCDYLPEQIWVDTYKNGEDPYYGETSFTYYDNGLLHTEKSFANKPNPIINTITYDDFGNIETKTLAATGEVSRTESFVYDNKHRFVTEKTNILGFTSFYTYDHRTGNLLNSTDIQGLQTIYCYDGFGRKTNITYPDGTWSSYSLHWDVNNPEGNILYYKQGQTTGGPILRTYYDKLGRQILDDQQDLTASMVRTKTVYDANGRVDIVSEPYYANSNPTQWTTYHYDEIGRVEQVDFPTHTETTVYDGTTTTVTNLSTGVTKAETTDAYGLTIAVTDPAGTIDYDYYSHGKPRAITAPDGSVFSMTYDDYLRQATLTDPDAKTVHYEEYSGFGELKR